MDLEMCHHRRTFGGLVHLVFLWTIQVVCLRAQDMSNPNSGSASQESRVYYTRIDELPANVVVGNVVRDANLHRKYGPDILDTFVLEIIGGNHKQYFQMETEVVGNLRTATYLDRDVVCQSVQDCHLTLDIAVVRPPAYFQIIQVTLTMLDNNDNSPQFSESETVVYISENAVPPVSFVLPTATDPDSGLYGIQSYNIIRRSSKFDLELMDSGDGGQDLRLKLLSRLNREDQASYSLQVQAKDGGLPPRIGILDIQVIVADANDNTPEFQLSVYNVSIPEDHPVKSAFLGLQATDPDEGLNGQVQYSLASQTMETYGDTFAINRDSGELSLLRSVDYEVHTNYHLLVTAQDQGPDSVPVHARVIVNIVDVNDFVPQIKVNAWTKTGRIEVLENEAGSFLAHVSVNDQDRGPSGQVTCNLTDTRFALEYMYTNTYKIITQTQLDREAEDTILLTVYCKDRGQPSLSSSVEVTVYVLDQNDHSPEFEQVIYSAKVLETAPIGTSVVRVRASDEDIDENAQITYHLHANSNNMLRVSPDTGVVITNSLLDHEHVESLRFFVLAVDNGDLARTATATVLLEITDVNDEKPIFLQPNSYTFGTLENQPVGTEIGTVMAEDNDAPPNDEFLYSLNDNSTFSIHPTTGLITTNKLLDREHQDAYYLTVTARNTQPPFLSGTVSLTIYVADKNDNAPKITFPREGNNTVEVSVFSPAGYIVTRVNATDVDSGNSGKLEFTFGKGNEDYMFGIDLFSGIITVEGDLSDVDSSDYNLLVLVRDQGESQKSAVASLNVIINRTMVFAELARIPPRSNDDGETGLGYHEQILIIIGAVTLVVVSLLIIAIICIKRRQGTRERDSYKYMCRVDMAKPNAKQGDAKDQPEKCAVIAGPQDMDKRMVKFNMEGPSPNQSGSFNSLGYPPGMDFPDKHVGLVTSTPQDPGSHPNHPSHTCPLHGNRSAPLGTFQRPLDQTGQHDKVHLSTPEKRDTVDSDSTSGCSADMSNSDSGRGPSEEGDPSHHRYHIHPKVKSPEYMSGRNKSIGPHLPPRTTSLTKNRSQTGCHGYRTDSHDNVNVNKPTQFSKVPNKDIIGRGPGFRNVTMNYNGDKSNSTQNLRTFSPGPGYAVEKNPSEMSSGEAINV